MKSVVAKYVALCDNCQRVKAEQQRLVGLLQPLKIPQWKWEEISMDFIIGLPIMQSGYDSIWVMVDRFSKVTLYRSRLHKREQSLRNCILLELCVYTECPRRWYLTEEPNLQQGFGKSYIR
jgi:hypothetical protein